ncbi:MAG TPA: hypothetical protein VFZ09_44825 [Archangium sp.]|uniref:hypothetical protein n=1 Tax=Archangium sp. TaxID=1872627 RepID=UPI002E2FEEF7|nr:hypothetical protein [Archangium sp.]HEX5753406.1 hypothetical protein [Archangium sp.]
MMRVVEKWGPHLEQSGWIAVPGDAAAPHLFGGSSWRILGGAESPPAPCLLLSLDLKALPESSLVGVSQLPLVLYLNCDLGKQTQEYQFDVRTRRIDWLAGDCSSGHPFGLENRIPEPLPERCVSLRPMQPEELPGDEERYWSACDNFLGGAGFLRVLGAPVWLAEPLEAVCVCGRHMRYVASLGYEVSGEPSVFLEGEQVLFVGEMAFYFFLCADCRRVRVLSQPSS